MIFTYRVKDKAGATSNGTLEANSLDDAVKMLRDRDLTVITVHEQTEVAHQTKLVSGFFARVGFGEIVEIPRQLSTMIIAGLPLIDSLALLEGQSRNPSLRTVLADIIQGIRGGKPFSEALKTHPKQFSKIYVALVQAGEKSGKLDVVLERLADNLEKTRSFRSKLKTAMIYPLIIVIGIVLLTMIMMIFVIPQLTEIYSSFDVELPLPTRILIGM